MTSSVCKLVSSADAHGGGGGGVIVNLSARASSENIPDTLMDRIICQKERSQLDLSLCQISTVPLDAIRTFYGEEVKSLDLSYNTIRTLPALFALKLTSLTKLDLSRNSLKQLPDNFGLMEQITYLDLHQNQLETLPLSMGKMRKLQFLNVSDNPFRSPLCNILSYEHLRSNRRLGRVESAHCIIKFFAELSNEIFASGDGAPAALSRSSATKRGVTFETEKEERDSVMDPLREDDRIRQRRHSYNGLSTIQRGVERRESGDLRQRAMVPTRTRAVMSLSDDDSTKQMSPRKMMVYGFLVTLLVFALFPLVTALLVGSATLEHQVQNHHHWAITTVWNYYQPLHAFAERVLNFLGITEDFRPLYFRDPPAEEEGNILLVAYRKVAKAISRMFSVIWN